MPKERSFQKVVIHTLKGEIFHGFADRPSLETKPGKSIEITQKSGKPQKFRLADIKAVFFVKDFKGDSKYEVVRFFDKNPQNPMVWVRLEFFDGEQIEGKVPNNIDILKSDGFFLSPADQYTNNEAVYVVKSSLSKLTFLFPA